MPMRTSLLLLLFLLAGCGYHVQGRQSNLPPDVRLVFVELFDNRTLEPFIENTVTSRISERFSRGRVLQFVGDGSGADAVLSGAVTDYQSDPISYDPQDRILEYRSTMSVTALLRRTSDGQVVWRGGATWTQEYPASRDKALQEDREDAAIRVIAERLADELYSRITSNF